MPARNAVELPDFRNLAVILRVVVLAEGLSLVLVLASAPDLEGILPTFLTQRPLFEPILLSCLLLLALFSPRLRALGYRRGVGTILLLVALVTLIWQGFRAVSLEGGGIVEAVRAMLLAALLGGALLLYFNWRHRVLSPALTEARLMALQSRIRPHFLFNSLNAVLGLMREDPRRAETVLENLADLFRASMAEPGMLVPLERELELAKSYAEVESMRLGPRLQVLWQCQKAPLDALVPPLIIQPLLENAVYHGIEPAEAGGQVTVSAFLMDSQLALMVRNPHHPRVERRSGNRLALNNIRERLALHFDAEADLRAHVAGGEYVVQIRIPYRRGKTSENLHRR